MNLTDLFNEQHWRHDHRLDWDDRDAPRRAAPRTTKGQRGKPRHDSIFLAANDWGQFVLSGHFRDRLDDHKIDPEQAVREIERLFEKNRDAIQALPDNTEFAIRGRNKLTIVFIKKLNQFGQPTYWTKTIWDKYQNMPVVPHIFFEDHEDDLLEKWTNKYKKSINCSNPKGFSQKAHCAARRKRARGGKTKSRPVHESAELLEAKKKRAKTLIDGMIKTLIARGRTHDEAVADLKKQIDSRFYEAIDAFAADEILEENLRDWFKQKWVRFGPDGKIRGACARGSDSEGKPKCLPQSKAHALGKKGRAKAARRKRREDPNPQRHGKAKNVRTKESVAEDTQLTPSVVRRMQAHLNKQYDANLDVDGVLGPLTVASIRKFMAKANKADAPDPSKTTAVQGLKVKTELDEKCWDGYHKEGMKTMFGKRVPNCVKTEDIEQGRCPRCGGLMVSEQELEEKKDACYYKVKSRYKVWPSAYASGALVQCRKKGAKNWGKSKVKENQDDAVHDLMSDLGKHRKSLAMDTIDDRYDRINDIMQRIAKANGVTAKQLHKAWIDRYGELPDEWVLDEDDDQEAAHEAEMVKLITEVENAFAHNSPLEALEAMEDMGATVHEHPELARLFAANMQQIADLFVSDLRRSADPQEVWQLADMLENAGIAMPDERLTRLLERHRNVVDRALSKALSWVNISGVIDMLQAMDVWGLHYWLEDFMDLEEGKQDVVKNMLQLMKGGRYRQVADIIQRLREEGWDWPEFAAFERSLAAAGKR